MPQGGGNAGAAVALTGAAAVVVALGVSFGIKEYERNRTRTVKILLSGSQIEEAIPTQDAEVAELFDRDCGRNKTLRAGDVEQILYNLQSSLGKSHDAHVRRVVQGACTQAVLAQPLMALMKEEDKITKPDSHVLLHKDLETQAFPSENMLVHDLLWNVVSKNDLEGSLANWKVKFEIRFGVESNRLRTRGVITATRISTRHFSW